MTVVRLAPPRRPPAPHRVLVLVPGAWLGAWAWEDTARALQERGHTALPVTLTGLAEHADQVGPQTDLDTHIADITGFVERNDLRDVTLVAHSYAAAPVTGAAGRLGDRLERVIYVDSAPFAAGMCMLDLMPPQAADQLRQQVDASGEGWRLPMPPFEVLGLSSSLDGLDEGQRNALRTRATPQPFGTFTQRLAGPAEPGPGVDRVLTAPSERHSPMPRTARPADLGEAPPDPPASGARPAGPASIPQPSGLRKVSRDSFSRIRGCSAVLKGGP